MFLLCKEITFNRNFLKGGILSVKVIKVENGIGEPSSGLKWSCLCLALGDDVNPSIFSLAMSN